MTDLKTQRDSLLDRYRSFRSAIHPHLNAALKCASPLAIKEAARRLGVLIDGAIVTEHFSEETLIFDLAVFGRKAGRSRAIDRYARATSCRQGSPEAITLKAMQTDIFRFIRVKGWHPVAGNIVEDLVRQEELWLLDEGLEKTLKEGSTLALRLIQIEDFHTTVGAIVPMTDAVFQEALYTVATRRNNPSILDDPRLPEVVYAAAISNGTMQRMAFSDE